MVNDVHDYMEQIRLTSQQISFHPSAIANIITQGDEYQTTMILPIKLKLLQDFANKSCKLAFDAEERVNTWMRMVSELAEACVAKKSLTDAEFGEDKMTLDFAVSRINKSKKAKTELNDDLEDLET